MKSFEENGTHVEPKTGKALKWSKLIKYSYLLTTSTFHTSAIATHILDTQEGKSMGDIVK